MINPFDIKEAVELLMDTEGIDKEEATERVVQDRLECLLRDVSIIKYDYTR